MSLPTVHHSQGPVRCKSVLYHRSSMVVKKSLTVMMRTHRKVAQAITRIPPPNKIIKPIFFSGLRLAFQSMGKGIDNR
jgi:hypothetical protein